VLRLRFLLTRRWLVFLLVVLALAWVAWRLGEWQFHRLEERKQRNAIIERNESLPPVAVEEVLAPGEPVAEHEQWRVVEATGEYAVDETVIVRYRTREGASGVDVVVPLDLLSGETLLVDRGWTATDNQGMADADVPPPPSGRVTVTGWVRADATGDSTKVTDLSTRSISSVAISQALGRQTLGGFVDLREEDPGPAQALEPVALPELDNGPHFFYGLQWWFFGVLALIGFVWLAVDELRGRPSLRGRAAPRDDG
jgi:cytochrome oxidase assembly protein ShyY1